MPRFVILKHDHPSLHWDLLLEVGDVLRAWRLSALPTPGQTLTAEPSFDHRLLYLDYEGPISGSRGRVVRQDWGTYAFLIQEEDQVRISLHGERRQGVLQLRKEAANVWAGRFTS